MEVERPEKSQTELNEQAERSELLLDIERSLLPMLMLGADIVEWKMQGNS